MKNDLFINKIAFGMEIDTLSDSANDLNKSLADILSSVQILLFDRLVAVIFAFKIIKNFIIKCHFA
jgi:hypothetical protein